MPLPSLASVSDLAVWLGETVTDHARAQAYLHAASTCVRSHTGRAWVDADGEPEASVSVTRLDAAKTVVLMVTSRLWHNPQGLKQTTTGPFSSTFDTSGLELTDFEKSILAEPVSGGIPGLTSIRVEAPSRAAGVPRSRWDWCEDDEDDGS